MHLPSCRHCLSECLTIALEESIIRVIIFIFTSKVNYSEHENKIQISQTS